MSLKWFVQSWELNDMIFLSKTTFGWGIFTLHTFMRSILTIEEDISFPKRVKITFQ